LLDFFLKNGNTLSVSDSSERSLNDFLKSLYKSLFNKLIKELEFFEVVSHHILKAELKIILSTCHIIFESSKCKFWLDHPELGEMSRGVRIFGAEGGTESVNITQGAAEVLHTQLPRDSEE
jgi:hypothetical protein